MRRYMAPDYRTRFKSSSNSVRALHVEMKTTRYFDQIWRRPDRSGIEEAWIVRVVNQSEHERAQSDGRLRRWRRVPEAGKPVFGAKMQVYLPALDLMQPRDL